MRKATVRRIAILLVLVSLSLLVISGCQSRPYSEKDVIGLSSKEIIAKFGDFDRTQGTPDSQGLYRSYNCGYLVANADYSFLGRRFPEYFMIHFDENGIADSCKYEEVA